MERKTTISVITQLGIMVWTQLSMVYTHSVQIFLSAQVALQLLGTITHFPQNKMGFFPEAPWWMDPNESAFPFSASSHCTLTYTFNPNFKKTNECNNLSATR